MKITIGIAGLGFTTFGLYLLSVILPARDLVPSSFAYGIAIMAAVLISLVGALLLKLSFEWKDVVTKQVPLITGMGTNVVVFPIRSRLTFRPGVHTKPFGLVPMIFTIIAVAMVTNTVIITLLYEVSPTTAHLCAMVILTVLAPGLMLLRRYVTPTKSYTVLQVVAIVGLLVLWPWWMITAG